MTKEFYVPRNKKELIEAITHIYANYAKRIKKPNLWGKNKLELYAIFFNSRKKYVRPVERKKESRAEKLKDVKEGIPEILE